MVKSKPLEVVRHQAQIEILGFLTYRAMQGKEAGESPALVSEFAERADSILDYLSGCIKPLILHDLDEIDLPPRPIPTKHKVKFTKAVAAPADEKPASAGFISIKARVLALIQKKPRTALELADEMDMEVGRIYPQTQILKNEKAIEGREDVDGTRRWFAATVKAEAV
jgi:hypothetical protein